MTVTEEEAVQEATEEATQEVKESTGSADANREKYRLISGEEILENGEARPSTLAFLGMYVLGALVFGVHMLFHNGISTADDAPIWLKLTAALIELTGGETLPIGFVLVMCFVTWANRMLNISTSGKWVTVSLLAITFLPIVITVDNLISTIAGWFGAADGAYEIPFLPDTYNYFLSGLAFVLVFWAFTYKYQRSFSYAVTTNAIIFQHAFLLSRSHRRILFDRISEVMVERTPMGTLLAVSYTHLTLPTIDRV